MKKRGEERQTVVLLLFYNLERHFFWSLKGPSKTGIKRSDVVVYLSNCSYADFAAKTGSLCRRYSKRYNIVSIQALLIMIHKISMAKIWSSVVIFPP